MGMVEVLYIRMDFVGRGEVMELCEGGGDDGFWVRLVTGRYGGRDLKEGAVEKELGTNSGQVKAFIRTNLKSGLYAIIRLRERK